MILIKMIKIESSSPIKGSKSIFIYELQKITNIMHHTAIIFFFLTLILIFCKYKEVLHIVCMLWIVFFDNTFQNISKQDVDNVFYIPNEYFVQIINSYCNLSQSGEDWVYRPRGHLGCYKVCLEPLTNALPLSDYIVLITYYTALREYWNDSCCVSMICTIRSIIFY